MIKWKKVGEHTPSNIYRYPAGTVGLYVTCLVWVCNPETINGGVPDVIRWDVKNNCWLEVDKTDKYIHSSPYHITHFCDEINIPEHGK